MRSIAPNEMRDTSPDKVGIGTATMKVNVYRFVSFLNFKFCQS